MNLWWRRADGWPGERFFCVPEALVPKLAGLSPDAVKLYLAILITAQARNAVHVTLASHTRDVIGLPSEAIHPASDELLNARLVRWFPASGVYCLLAEDGSNVPPLDGRNVKGNRMTPRRPPPLMDNPRLAETEAKP